MEDIALHDLKDLLSNEVSESRTIEYKLLLAHATTGEKKELLADITCMANTAGGDLLFGVEESAGVPVALPGFAIADWDALQTQLTSLIRDGTEPRLHQVDLHRIEVSPDRYVVVLRVGRSQRRPHRVVVGGHGHFYGRDSSQKYRLDVEDLRRAFTLMAAASGSVDRFWRERVRAIGANEGFAQIGAEQRAVLHLVPELAFQEEPSIELGSIDPMRLRPLPRGPLGLSWSYAAEGMYTYNDWAYTALFRNGVIEAAEGLVTKDGVLYPAELQMELIEGIRTYLALMEDLGLSPPVRILLALTGVANHTFPAKGLAALRTPNPPFRESTCEIRGPLIETFQLEVADALRPLFDRLWNAFGYAGCPNYDETGHWTGP